MAESVSPQQDAAPSAGRIRLWIGVVAFVYLLLLGVAIIGDGFKWISGGAAGAERIFLFASNPVAGVMLGLLATALVQSSSTVTAVIVGLVAGGVPVELAVPMIMGANMGTTITNTIVSLGAVGERTMFNKSFQAATVHDFFNFYSILIFLPLEMLFHPLERLAGAVSTLIVGASDASVGDFNVLGMVTKPVAGAVVRMLEVLPSTVGAVAAIVAGTALVIVSVVYLGRTLRAVMTGPALHMVQRVIGAGPLQGVATGAAVTVLVQSSSTTTSLVVPLAGAGVLTTRQVFPFTMGANIGTCITALLAATALPGATQVFALQIALVHLFYNVAGVLVFLYTPWLRDLPVRSAQWLGRATETHRGWAFGYLGAVFFILPGAVFAGGVLTNQTAPAVVEAERDATRTVDAAEQQVEESALVIE